MTQGEGSDAAEPQRSLEDWDRLIADRLIERLAAYEAEHGPVQPASEAFVWRARHTKAQQMPVIKALLIGKGWLKK